jgi:hypothetical protein
MAKIVMLPAIAVAGLLITGCESLFNPGTGDTERQEDETTVEYLVDTASVDYKKSNNVVYFDFSTGTKTVTAHDTWHFAFDANLNVIANSGNYGSDVAVCSTGVTDFTQNFTTWFADTSKYFTRTDTNANILGRKWMNSTIMPPTFSKQVYLLKTKGSGNYKIQITGAGMNGSIKVKIATPAETMAEELSYTHNSEYEYTYIDCSSKQAVLVAPKTNTWDLRFGRTEFAMGTATGGRSSIAINSAGGVSVAVAEGKNIDEVTDASSFTYSNSMFSIGHGWYAYDHDAKVYSVAKNTYVLKTTEGKFAKFQIATFDGPGGEAFWCLFEYLYQDDSTAFFSK